ncbi:MAG: flagellar hook-associated protein FlgL, partial [Paraglaciecola sp.]|uniref:flagellar hook-associated protein FlgL n=1 Tax=Paraglaciecola sp. TaxID=1920173 RepID=UPI0032977706
MRISTAQLYDRSIQAVLDNQLDLSNVQQQLSSGKKILRPSDDPVGATQVIRLTEEIDLINQYKVNNDLLNSSLEQEETILSSINSAIDRARVLMVESGNGIMTSDDRNAIGIEIEQIRDQVFDLMNSQNSSGEYIFAGYQSSSPAFSYNASSSENKYSFEGDDGTSDIRISDTVSLQVNNTGAAVFENVEARNKTNISGTSGITSASMAIVDQGSFDKFYVDNYDAVTAANNEFRVTIVSANQVQISNVGTGLDLGTLDFESGTDFSYKGLEFNIEGSVGNTVDFELAAPEKKNIAETLNDFAIALMDEDITEAAFADALSDVFTGTDNALTKIGEAISQIGGKMNVADSVLASNLDLEIANKTARSNIEDVDYA